MKYLIRAIIKWAMAEELWSFANYKGHTGHLMADVAPMRGNRMRIYQLEKHLGLTNSFHSAEIYDDNAFAGFESEKISEREIAEDLRRVKEHHEKYWPKKSRYDDAQDKINAGVDPTENDE